MAWQTDIPPVTKLRADDAFSARSADDAFSARSADAGTAAQPRRATQPGKPTDHGRSANRTSPL